MMFVFGIGLLLIVVGVGALVLEKRSPGKIKEVVGGLFKPKAPPQ